MPHHRGMSILAVDPEAQVDCNGVPVGLVPGLVTSGLTKSRTADPLLIRWRLIFSPLTHSQCQLQVYFLHYHQHQTYAGVAHADTNIWKP